MTRNAVVAASRSRTILMDASEPTLLNRGRPRASITFRFTVDGAAALAVTSVHVPASRDLSDWLIPAVSLVHISIIASGYSSDHLGFSVVPTVFVAASGSQTSNDLQSLRR